MEVPIHGGHVALVDGADAELVGRFRWYVLRSTNTLYARAWLPREGGKRKQVYMHALVAGSSTGGQVDHINGDGLDNRRSNLRPADHSKNGANRAKGKPPSSSQFKGVYYSRDPRARKQWTAAIRVRGKRIHLGSFPNEREAALAYDVAAVRHFGGYARENFSGFPVDNCYQVQ
jgi:hypothetical protein